MAKKPGVTRRGGQAQLVDQVERIVRDSGDPTGLDASRWVTAFPDALRPAPDGRRPREFMRTSAGRAAVVRLAAQMQSGAHA